MIKLILFISIISSIFLYPKEIKVGVYDFYPSCFKDKDGEIKGIYIDVLNEISKTKNWEIAYSYSSLNDNFNKLRNGELDLIPGLVKNDERLTFIDFSTIPILSGWSSFHYNKKYKIESIADLENKRVGLVKNDVNNEPFLEILFENKVTVQIKYYDEFSEMLPEIKNDSVVGGIFRSLLYEWQDPDNIVIPSIIKFQVSDNYIAVPKGRNQDIIYSIDSILNQWKSDENSKYYEILDKWINPKPDYLKNIIILLLILTFSTFTYFLYRIYKKRM